MGGKENFLSAVEPRSKIDQFWFHFWCSAMKSLSLGLEWLLLQCVSIVTSVCGISGVLYHRWGKPKEAEAAYRKALALNPQEPNVQENLAMLLRKNSKSWYQIRGLWINQPLAVKFFEKQKTNFVECHFAGSMWNWAFSMQRNTRIAYAHFC